MRRSSHCEQQALVPAAHNEKQVVAAINNIVQRARAANKPVIYIQHCHQQYEPMMKGEDGWQIYREMDYQTSDELVEKTASDAFYGTNLAERLQLLCVLQLVITGMQTEYCVDATCRAAMSHDLNVLLVADGHTTGDAGMSAKDIVRHHNEILPNLANPHYRRVVEGVYIRA
ncbi:MAG: nicotinamidase-related amidase [Candidatus Azotimanducaceae bacterium]|jgi:nicotinamidase-related amidase